MVDAELLRQIVHPELVVCPDCVIDLPGNHDRLELDFCEFHRPTEGGDRLLR